ncbi:ABC transporter substrate-binding protein [Specibacter cremeus]|uniref:ABC transporter substrate-binding protein n=1 Tax=Specibacter cremeus TaxID=1629051 RepID=UPI000F7A8746|nr:sugar ABC transporter substrate-binding protein [Specibacter cremeus]
MKPTKKTRIGASVAVAVAATMLLGACGSGNNASPDGTVTLNFAWWGNDVRNKATEQVISDFEASHPKIKIAGQPGQWSSYWDKLATVTAANNAPDVIQMDQAYIAEYGGRGALLDLSKQSGVDTSKIADSALKSGQVDGKQYGISTGQNAYVIMANTKVFKDAGVPLPNDKTWTWDDFLNTAAQIAKKLPGNYGASYGATDANMNVWLKQHGQSLFTADGKLGFTTDALTQYYQFLVKQRDMGAGPSASLNSEDASASVEQTLFGKGKLAMGFWWSNQVTALTKATKAEIKLLRVPSTTGNAADNGMYFKPSMFWSTSSRTKHPKEAAEFIDFLANSTDAGKIILTDRGFPSNTDVQAAIADKLTPTDKAVGTFLKDITPDVAWTPPVPPVGTGSIGTVISRYNDDVLFNRQSPAQAAAAFTAEVQGLLDSGRK